MVTWYPDFCPTGQCMIELEKANGSVNWTVPKRLISLCPHHQNVKNVNALDDTGVFRAILQSSRVKEVARNAIHSELALANDIDIPYTVELSGHFLIQSGVSGARRQRIISRVNESLSAIEQPPGTSRVTVQ